MWRRLMASLAVAAVAVLLVATPRGASAADKKNSDQTVRSVQGTVTDANDNAVDGPWSSSRIPERFRFARSSPRTTEHTIFTAQP